MWLLLDRELSHINSYSWNFGDGASSSQQNPTHTYTQEGTYSATLTVTDDDGSIGTRTVTITVISNQPPTASPSANPRSGPAPLPVTFTGSGTDSDGYIVSYSWTFGDGESSSKQNPTHTYTTEGTYSAKLTVTDNGGKTGDKTITITVTKPPEYPKSITFSTQVNLTIVTDAFSITSDGTYYYVIDQTSKNVYKYDNSYTYTGTWFSYQPYTLYVRGITYHNGDLYIVGTRSYWFTWYREIFKFSTNGYYEGKWDIGAYIGDPKSLCSDGQYLYVGDQTAPYKIAYFDSSDMSYKGYIPNSHPPHGIAIDKSAHWYFVTAWGGDVNRIYLCAMNGIDQWSTSFNPYIEDIVIINDTLIRIDGKSLYIYNINY
jgi:PKD repeat protein